MNYRHHAMRLLALCTVALTALAAPQTRAHAQYSIDYVIKPYKPDILDSWFFGINNRGEATGYVAYRDGQGAFLQSPVIYRGGDYKLLAVGPGGYYLGNTGFAINDRGEVVATVNSQPTFFDPRGRQVPMVTPGYMIDTSSSTPGLQGINDAGTVLVGGYTPLGLNEEFTVSERHGLWNQKGFRILSELDPLYPIYFPFNLDLSRVAWYFTYTSGFTGLNSDNQFAASITRLGFDPMDLDNPNDDVYTEDFYLAYVYDGKHGYSLLRPLAAGDAITPLSIDKKGEVFGWTGGRLAIWRPDGSLKLVLPVPEAGLYRYGIFGTTSAQRNEHGTVLALSSTGGVLRYSPKKGGWTDITSSINGLGTGRVYSIQGLNDHGQFVGLATPPLNFNGWFGYVISPAKDDEE